MTYRPFRSLLLLLLLASPALGQVVELKAGDSTLYDAAGASAVIYLPTQTITAGVGVDSGHFVIGLQSQFAFHGWDAVAGDSELYLTTGQAGVAEALRGLAVSKHDDTQALTLFAGLTGSAFTVPYFSGTTAKTPAAGVQFARVLKNGFAFKSVETISSHKYTALEELDYTRGMWKLTGVGGLLEGKPFADALAQGRWSHAAAMFSHNDYILEGQHAQVNSANASFMFGSVVGSVAAFQSQRASGQSLAIRARAGMFTVQGQELFSATGRTTAASISEQISRHMHLTQYITRSSAKTSFDFGGGYSNRVASIDVAFQQQFQPFNNVAFGKTLVVQLSLHVHGMTLNGGTLTVGGKTRWTAFGDTFTQGPLSTGAGQERHSLKGQEIHGRITTPDGTPVEGGAVRIGRETVYSSSGGSIVAREDRNASVPVRVLLDEFLVGSWEVVSCPPSADAGTMVQIIVRRK
jgi:hypothetical protein